MNERLEQAKGRATMLQRRNWMWAPSLATQRDVELQKTVGVRAPRTEDMGNAWSVMNARERPMKQAGGEDLCEPGGRGFVGFRDGVILG